MNLSMIDLITSKHRHLLWRDECDDDFLLMKFGTIWRYSKTVLGLNVFVRKVCRLMLSQGLIYDHQALDDTFDLCFAKVEKLSGLIARDNRAIRMKRNCKMHRELEHKLAHKIYPYRTKQLL